METFVVLDYLPNGHISDQRPMHLREPLIQILSEKYLVLLEAVPADGYTPNLRDRTQNDDRTKIKRVMGRINFERLTQTAKKEAETAVTELVMKNEKQFVDFFNKACPLTTRQHSLELLPGIGKKHMWDIIGERKKKPFESFTELQGRIRLMPDPARAIVKRIVDELQEKDRYYLFVQPPVRRERPYGW